MLPHFFFNATATTEIYTLSLHDALPISVGERSHEAFDRQHRPEQVRHVEVAGPGIIGEGQHRGCEQRSQVAGARSEEHTSELQSQSNLVCRLLLEKKKKKKKKRERK